MIKPKPKQIRHHIFNNIEYSIEWTDLGCYKTKLPSGKYVKDKLWGETDDPSSPYPTMSIHKNQNESELLNTLIHESIHATNYKLDERVVTRMADDISSFLWNIGFRLNKS